MDLITELAKYAPTLVRERGVPIYAFYQGPLLPWAAGEVKIQAPIGRGYPLYVGISLTNGIILGDQSKWVMSGQYLLSSGDVICQDQRGLIEPDGTGHYNTGDPAAPWPGGTVRSYTLREWYTAVGATQLAASHLFVSMEREYGGV